MASDDTERRESMAELHKFVKEQELVVVDIRDSTVCEGEYWFDGLDDLDSFISDLVEIRDDVRLRRTEENQ